MKIRWLVPFFGLLLGCSWTVPLQAAPPREPLVDQVRMAIKNGVQFLRDKQVLVEGGKGHWEIEAGSLTRPGGWTCLAMLALLNSGVKPDDPAIQKGLQYLRDIPPDDTYVVGLQIMVFAAAGSPLDKERIQRNVDWLVDSWVKNGQNGWTYKKYGAGSDNSNTQYALLGLHEGQLAGAHIDPNIWQAIQNFYINTQIHTPEGDGAWSYSRNLKDDPTLTMTTAGLSGLLITGMEINTGREEILKDGTIAHCGTYKENPNINRALGWIGRHFRIEIEEPPRAIYYNLYGIERAGRLSGLRFLGEHDWYREGCEWLVKRQREDGSWMGQPPLDHWPVVSTSFALLFLSKGRTPVLISKLVHGPGNDWNNDRNDARHLVEFAGRTLFKNQPLAWQVFDAKRDLVEDNPDEILRVTGDLLQSPILYFNGHEVPRFTDQEIRLLRQYLDQGGFILAEACCGKEPFKQGFRDLMKQVFSDSPETELKPLKADHALWHAHFLIKHPEKFPLEGIERGCKTVVVFSPTDLSCYWESNQYQGIAQEQFELGANIVAYATGMELPRPRLTAPDLVIDKDKDKKVPRGYLKVVQLRHEGEWQPAPEAMRNLMIHVRDQLHLDVAVQTEALLPSNPNLLEFKFLYLHGREEFSYTEDDLANLRADLNTGGLLFSDACCGRKAFDKSFREFAARLYPDHKLEPIPLEDELFSKELNGQAITTVRCRRERADGTGPEDELHEVPP
ncbi:MAG: DUF4159 domain-containing protein, partial [Planctomycetes bacterium]|nr:DUF4159 domain-containing protein [Planctomycetota bacterium]